MGNAVKVLLKGAQTWIHRIRMLRQVVRVALFTSFLFGLAASLTLFVFQTPKERFFSPYYYLKASLNSSPDERVEIRGQYMEWMSRAPYPYKYATISSKQLERFSERDVERLWDGAKGLLKTTLALMGVGFFSFFFFFFFRGKKLGKKKLLSGQEIKKRRVRKMRTKGGLRIGKAVLNPETETEHLLITGASGSGKTNAMNQLLAQIRKRKQKAVIIDTTTGFISRFYNPNKDYILNPFDARTQHWTPWGDCRNARDYKGMATKFIPIKEDYDFFWRQTAAIVFESALKQQEACQDTQKLKELLLEVPLAEFVDEIKQTKGAAVIDPKGDRTALSIRGMMISRTECLEYLHPTTTPFSIVDWMQSDTEDSFLFLTSRIKDRPLLRPLLSVWFSVAIEALMEMGETRDRRIPFICDELPTMDKVTGLETLVTEGRKYGACAILALQSPTQLKSAFGENDAFTIMSQMGTTLVFKEKKAKIAKEISQEFGEKEIQETQEGISYGAHEMRDGVSQSMIKKHRPVISATEIQNLATHECFLKKADSAPIEKLKLKYLKLPKIAEAFIEGVQTKENTTPQATEELPCSKQ
ncbi:MAG: type IV secretion system DNA-binding domain-containing protein [Chlamydiota bacterium]